MGTSKGYLPPTGHLWSGAKRAVTNMAKNNFGRESVGKAISKFANAKTSSNGGSSSAFSNFSISGAKAINFLNYAKQYGFDEALREVGLQNLIGKKNDEVYVGLLDYFSGEGSTLDKNVVRDSMSEVLKENMDDITDDKDYDDIIANIDINKFIIDFITAFTQKSFLTNFSEKIEGLCKNLDEYISAENNIKDFIRVEIERKYNFEDLSKIDWKGEQGKEFINKKCSDAYEIFKMWKDDIDEDMD